MSEELGINRSFRNSTTVDCKILTVLSSAVLVDYPRDVLLSDTAFSRNEDSDIGRSYSNSNLQRPVERRIIADNIVFVFKTL